MISSPQEMSILDLDVVVLCEELTALEKERLGAIPRSELLQGAWEQTDQPSVIRSHIQKWNNMTLWLQSMIVCHVSLKRRTEALKKLIVTMNACLDHGNYVSVMTILSALERPAITRLKKTWSNLPPKYSILKNIVADVMSPLANHRKYRKHLEERLESTKGFIPLMGLVFRDISLVLQTNPDTLDDGKANFDKLQVLGKLVGLVETAQRRAYLSGTWRSSPRIREWLDASPDLAAINRDAFEEKIWQNSTLCEPQASALV